jgi:hypothetical protein
MKVNTSISPRFANYALLGEVCDIAHASPVVGPWEKTDMNNFGVGKNMQ